MAEDVKKETTVETKEVEVTEKKEDPVKVLKKRNKELEKENTVLTNENAELKKVVDGMAAQKRAMEAAMNDMAKRYDNTIDFVRKQLSVAHQAIIIAIEGGLK